MRSEDKTAVLLVRESPGRTADPYKMTELRGLAHAAGYHVLAEISQRRGRDHLLPRWEGERLKRL